MQFKVGDLIKGTEKGSSKYLITTFKMKKAVVLKELEGHLIRIKIIEHENPDKIGFEHDVDSIYFEKYGEKNRYLKAFQQFP